jgi:alkaline phosphatase D
MPRDEHADDGADEGRVRGTAAEGAVDESDPTRRDVLARTGGSVAAGVAATLAGRGLVGTVEAATNRTDRRPEAAAENPEATFPQSVASGDPTPDGVVLWTRLAPDRYRDGESVTATVARDEAFDDVVGTYEVPGGVVGPGTDYTVRLTLDGELDPGTAYHYRFAYRGVASRTGRCRTLPAPDASPDSVSFALCTCQDYRNGYYGAYGHVAEADVDFLVHLGDFIYESAGPSAYDGRDVELPSGASQAMDLADFRHLHRTYRTDRFLRRALRRHTLIATWDDHEIVNNRYWDYEADAPGCWPADHPAANDAERLRDLFADGIRAWWEYLPARVRYDEDAPLRERIRLNREFAFGDLVDLVVTDERLHRSEQAGTQRARQLSFQSDDESGSSRTILGERQREWFLDSLDASEATWTAWANEVLNMAFSLREDGNRVYNADAWDGYEAERATITDALADVANAVALTGDMHTALAGYVQQSYPDDDEASPSRVGVEFMTPAVTSVNLGELLELPDGEFGRRLASELVAETNPHVEFFDSHHWGYATVTFTPDNCTYSAWAVDKDSDEMGDRERLVTLRVRAGETEIRDVR